MNESALYAHGGSQHFRIPGGEYDIQTCIFSPGRADNTGGGGGGAEGGRAVGWQGVGVGGGGLVWGND